MNSSRVIFVIDDPKWKRPASLLPKLRRAGLAALKAAGGKSKASLTILLSNDAKLKDLNRNFRGKNKPTNVLSFPAEEKDYLGDVAIAFGVTQAEAKDSGKSFSNHAAHLVVHGVLHLLGHDHETAKDAKAMEPLEVKILAALGIPDPYLVRV